MLRAILLFFIVTSPFVWLAYLSVRFRSWLLLAFIGFSMLIVAPLFAIAYFAVTLTTWPIRRGMRHD